MDPELAGGWQPPDEEINREGILEFTDEQLTASVPGPIREAHRILRAGRKTTPAN